MAVIRRKDVTLTTDASGDATGYTEEINGKICSITYTKTDYANGVDFTVTTEQTAQNLWVELNVNAGKTVAPRQAVHDTAGAGVVYTSDNKPIVDAISLCQERVKIVVAQGGNTKTGKFTVYYE